jgi:hypothetical protein
MKESMKIGSFCFWWVINSRDLRAHPSPKGYRPLIYYGVIRIS